MASVNKVILIGNCGRDPEIRYLPDGKAVANVSIATSTKRKNRETGETTESTEWHRVTFYERLAEIAGEYVKKGRPIYVEGRLKYGTYVDKQTGAEKNTVDIIATELQLLGGNERAGGQDDGGGEQQRPAAPAQRQQAPQGGGQGFQQRPQTAQAPQGGGQQRPAAAPAQRPQAPQGGYQNNSNQPARASSGFDDMDDDIPF